jgi:hypothetical protein
MAVGQPLERRGEVVLLLVDVTRLLQLVPTAQVERADLVTHVRVCVLLQPRGCLHDVRVRVVHDAPQLVVPASRGR